MPATATSEQPRQHVRPLSRRVNTVLTGPTVTLFFVGTILYLTGIGIVVFTGPGTAAVAEGIVEFGASMSDGAVEFQGIILGVLGALLIGRVIAPVPDLRNQTVVEVGSALAAHFLAAIVVSTALLAAVSSIATGHLVGRVWFYTFLSIIAFLLAQAIDAGVTLGAKRQRRRTRNALITTSWSVHRRAALLHEHRNVRQGPLRKLITVVAGTIISAAGAGIVVVTFAWGSASVPYLPTIVITAVVLATWSTLWSAALLISIRGAVTSPSLTSLAWTVTACTTLLPVGIKRGQ